jgi:hypothetical protein
MALKFSESFIHKEHSITKYNRKLMDFMEISWGLRGDFMGEGVAFRGRFF